MRIRKTSQTTETPAEIVNTYNESTKNGYSCDYLNGEKLFDGSLTGTNSATLSDNINNYRYLEIYGTMGGNSHYIKVQVSSDIYSELVDIAIDGNIYAKICRFNITGTTLQIINNSEWYKASSSSSGGYNATGNYGTINKVIGYK